MNAIIGRRVTHEFTQTNPAPPDKVFSLLCPVREAEWVPGWNYQLIYSDSGVAEMGCVFTTIPSDIPNAKLTWMTTDYDPAVYRIAYICIHPEHVLAELRIQLAADGENTRTHIQFRYTGLSAAGNREIETYDRKWFEKKMHGWKSAISHYLLNGTLISQG
jgi:hypothetical protein